MVYLFDQFELREKDFCLIENGRRIALEPKALRVLLLLLSKAGHLVEKDFLLETVWSNTFVEENTLTRTILVLRRALGDNRHDRIFIETVPTKGYRFVHEVRQILEEEDPSHASAVAIEEMPGEEPAIASGAIESAGRPRVGRPGLSIWRRYLPMAVTLVVFTVAVCGWWRYRMHTKADFPMQPSIAVLPIVNQTGDSGNDYISDGVTESSIQQLSGITGVRVIGSGSVARYKGTQQDVRSVGRTLGVDTVLQGHLRRAEGRLMLVVELCRVSDGSPVQPRISAGR
jgi:DNA-binding winged helix-turn-helix (wHTH) protein/TolB-like protein